MKYQVIVADPAWSFSDKLTMSSTKRGAAANYSTLRVSDIVALPVASVAADDSILALWVPSSLIADGLQVIQAWGFKQKTIWTWVKGTERNLAFGLGHTFRGCTEHALIGTRGSVKKLIRNHSQRNVSIDPNLRHSAKPETLQDRLEMMVEGERLELFAGRERPGWVRCNRWERHPGLTVGVAGWR
jgi:N6-adenosine-specific RNA methylase IME4